MKSEVLMEVNITVFWDVTPCNLVDRYHGFASILRLKVDDKGNR
jgi:hypothetical protein